MPYGGGPTQQDIGASLGASEVNECLGQKYPYMICVGQSNGQPLLWKTSQTMAIPFMEQMELLGFIQSTHIQNLYCWLVAVAHVEMW